MENNLSILAWNCRSLTSKLTRFKLLLYTHKPHIACLTETWTKAGQEPSFINYCPFWKHRQDRTGGGLVILARNITLLPNQFRNMNGGKLEVQMISLRYNKDKELDVMNIYNAGHPITEQEFRFYFQQLRKGNIITGDFNAHHTYFHDTLHSNTTGNNLFSIIESNPNLRLLTPRNFPTS